MKAPFALSLSKGNDVHFLCKAPNSGTAGSGRLGPALPPLILLRSADMPAETVVVPARTERIIFSNPSLDVDDAEF